MSTDAQPELISEESEEEDKFRHSFIQRIDHVGIQTDDPDGLFKRFTQDFKLPIWIDMQRYPTLTSGAINLGNMFLEVFHFGPASAQASISPLTSQYYILSFLPHIASQEVLKHLDQRSIPHSTVMSFYEVKPPHNIIWENIFLGRMFGSTLWQQVFLWSSRLWRTFSKNQQQTQRGGRLLKYLMNNMYPYGCVFFTAYRQILDTERFQVDQQALQAVDGGIFGITGVKAINIGVSRSSERLWWRLLAPTTPDLRNWWHFSEGPALNLNVSIKPTIQGLMLGVRDLDHAKQALAHHSIRYTETAHKVTWYLPEAPQICFEFIAD